MAKQLNTQNCETLTSAAINQGSTTSYIANLLLNCLIKRAVISTIKLPNF